MCVCLHPSLSLSTYLQTFSIFKLTQKILPKCLSQWLLLVKSFVKMHARNFNRSEIIFRLFHFVEFYFCWSRNWSSCLSFEATTSYLVLYKRSSLGGDNKKDCYFSTLSHQFHQCHFQLVGSMKNFYRRMKKFSDQPIKKFIDQPNWTKSGSRSMCPKFILQLGLFINDITQRGGGGKAKCVNRT